jgi:hypothetical protein
MVMRGIDDLSGERYSSVTPPACRRVFETTGQWQQTIGMNFGSEQHATRRYCSGPREGPPITDSRQG